MRKLPKLILALVCALFFSLTSAASSFSNQFSVDVSSIVDHADNLRPQVLQLALEAYDNAVKRGITVKRPMLTIIDYSLPSYEKRLWVIDLSEQRVLFHTLVAQGKNTGWGPIAKNFSDQPGSLESSLGLYLTKGTYFGHRGLSLQLAGLDRGFNDRAEARKIVMHGAWYVNQDLVKKYGYTGASWGCPAVPLAQAKPIIDTIKDGTLIFAYYPEKRWLDDSVYLQQA